MASCISTITNAACRKPGEPLNILSFATHERYFRSLAKTGHNFYLWNGPRIKEWNTKFGDFPENVTNLLPDYIPPDVDFDLVLSQNKWGQFEVASKYAQHLHTPLISLEHTLPPHALTPEQAAYNRAFRGHINVFLSEYSRQQWAWDDDYVVVKPGFDTDFFCPSPTELPRTPHLLSVVNDWINRDVFCGFNLWKEVTKDLPVCVLGNTPGLSEPASSLEELREYYRRSQIFVNTSLVSTCPFSLCEAMACGCAVVSTATTMIPEIITNGVNGYCTNEPAQMRAYIEELLANPERCRKLGETARQTILDKFSEKTFVEDWNKLFWKAATTVYRGEYHTKVNK